ARGRVVEHSHRAVAEVRRECAFELGHLRSGGEPAGTQHADHGGDGGFVQVGACEGQEIRHDCSAHFLATAAERPSCASVRIGTWLARSCSKVLGSMNATALLAAVHCSMNCSSVGMNPALSCSMPNASSPRYITIRSVRPRYGATPWRY